DDLQPDRKSGAGEATGNGDGGLPGEIERIGEDAGRVPVHLHPVDLRRIETTVLEGDGGGRGREGQVVLLEEAARVLPQREPIEPRLHVAGGWPPQCFLDDREQAGVDV